MTVYLTQIPENIQQHIKEITKTSGLEDTDESVQMIAQGWLEKKKIFEDNIQSANMEETELLEKDDSQGAIVMTYSGSILNIGPVVDGKRKVEYASIGLRKDVPDFLVKEGCELKNDIAVDEDVEFINGAVKKTSPVFKIVVFSEKLSAEEQEQKMTRVSTFIVDDFVAVNKTIVPSND